jgi:glycosyltransferase involved in cell wall biosynthesis
MLRRIQPQLTGEFEVSGVMLIHNEENLLPLSLNSLQKANIKELIVVLDNCTDRSEEMINWFKCNSNIEMHIIKVTKHNWKYSTAEFFD